MAGEIVDGAVFNSGQSCCSIERVYVDEKIHDTFVAAMQEVLKNDTTNFHNQSPFRNTTRASKKSTGDTDPS